MEDYWQLSLLSTKGGEMTAKDAIFLARKYNLEQEVRQELAAGLTPEEALREWDVIA